MNDIKLDGDTALVSDITGLDYERSIQYVISEIKQ